MRIPPIARWSCVCMAVVWLLPLSAGCHKEGSGPEAYTGPTLNTAAFNPPETDSMATGYVIVEQEPSTGRFPAALAVARLAVPNMYEFGEQNLGDRWVIDTIPEEQATYWNALFNTIPFVREVLVLDKPVVMWPDANTRQINTAAERLKTDLCLIYGPRTAPSGEAAFTGAILNAHTADVVAYVRAQAGSHDFRPPRTDTFENDLRHKDPNYIAARKFEWEVRKCVAELAARDRPVTTTQPSRWRRYAIENQQRAIYFAPSRTIGW